MRALITGASRRLGAAIALGLAEKGYSLVIHYCHEKNKAEEIARQCMEKGGEAQCLQGDFSTIEGVLRFTECYLSLFTDTDVLIHNVGEYFLGSALETPLQDWLHLFQMNLHAPFLLSQRLTPHLIRRKGSIISIGVSGLSKQGANTYAACYHLTKQGLWGLTRSLALELAPHHVQVNMVSPGMLDISVDLPQEMKNQPWGSPMDCQTVVRTIVFLLEPSQHTITGQNIEIAGGLGLK